MAKYPDRVLLICANCRGMSLATAYPDNVEAAIAAVPEERPQHIGHRFKQLVDFFPREDKYDRILARQPTGYFFYEHK